MPAAPIVGAVIAIAAAAEIATPIAIGLAVVATAGAVASTVGTITGDKTLSLVGGIMSAVGSVGSIANGLGFFGAEAAGALGSGGVGVTNAAGGAAAEIAPTAVDTATATGGLNAYTPEFLQTFDSAYAASGNVEGALSSANAAVAGTAGSSGQSGSIVNMLSGEVNPLTVPSAEPVTPAPDVSAPAATNTAVSPEGLAPNPSADLAVEPTKGLINLQPAETPPPVSGGEFGDPVPNGTPMVETQPVTPTDYMSANAADPNAGTGPTDINGNPMAQGDLADWGSPAGNGGPTPARDASTAYADGTYDDGSQMWQGADNPNAKVTGQAGVQTPAQPAPATAAGNGTMPTADQLINYKDLKPGDITRADNSIWGDIWGFAKENKSLVLGGMMSLGSFMSGALSPKTPAEVDALNAQAERNRAAAQLEYTQNQLAQRRLANMSQPLPIARRGGLINMAPVTGRVA